MTTGKEGLNPRNIDSLEYEEPNLYFGNVEPLLHWLKEGTGPIDASYHGDVDLYFKEELHKQAASNDPSISPEQTFGVGMKIVEQVMALANGSGRYSEAARAALHGNLPRTEFRLEAIPYRKIRREISAVAHLCKSTRLGVYDEDGYNVKPSQLRRRGEYEIDRGRHSDTSVGRLEIRDAIDNLTTGIERLGLAIAERNSQSSQLR